MPDTTNQRLPGEVFERSVVALVPPPPGKLKAGGILSPDQYKSFIVNIRPTKWEETFWIGRIDNYVNAQFIADAVYHYIGHPSFHLKNAHFEFPPLECSGASTRLTNREMCLKYVTSIAKGKEFKSQRLEFRKCVKKLALEEVKNVEVQRVLRQFRDESGSALLPAQDVVENNNNHNEDDDENGLQEDHPTPMEVDDENEQAAHLSLVLSSQETVDRNVEGRNAHVPGFDMSDPGFTLQSDLTPVDFFLVDAYLGDSEDHHGSPTNDEEDFGSATRVLEENSFDLTHCPSAFENFRVNFFAMEDAL